MAGWPGGRVIGSAAVRAMRLVRLVPVPVPVLLWFVGVAALIGVVFAEQWAAML